MQVHAVFKDGVALGRPVIHGDAINEALRMFGVQASPEIDEFDTVRLGRHRITEEWLTESVSHHST
jgi:hypothetical protein